MDAQAAARPAGRVRTVAYAIHATLGWEGPAQRVAQRLLQPELVGVAAPLEAEGSRLVRPAVTSFGVAPVLRVLRNTLDRIRQRRLVGVVREPLQVLLSRARAR